MNYALYGPPDMFSDLSDLETLDNITYVESKYMAGGLQKSSIIQLLNCTLKQAVRIPLPR